jgi:hypothetical protein
VNSKEEMMSEGTDVGGSGTPVDPVAAKLKALGVDDAVVARVKEDLGAETESDLAGLTETDLVGAGMKKLQARKVVASLKPAPADTVASAAAVGMSFDAVLPAVPDDGAWLMALRTGGVLKVEPSTVIAAVRSALAHRAGLYRVPDALVGLMEKFADTNEEQVPPEFYKLRKEMTRRSYAEIFEAIPGLDGNFVTEGRKKQLFQRIDEKLWPSIVGFNEQLKSWQTAWMQGAANPMMMMTAIVAASGGGVAMPPGMMQPPDTGAVRDSADAVADAVNRVFAGTGVQIASALAYDAKQIREALDNSRLPAMVGAANRDQMLRQLGVGVSATYTRLEVNLTRYVLAILQIKDLPGGNEELQYFGTLYMLGSQIPWDQLEGGRSGRLTGIGGRDL